MKRRQLAFLMATLLLSACAVMQQLVQAPQVRLTDMKLSKAGLFEQILEFELELANPNAFSLPLAGMNYTLELSGVEVGQGSQTQAVTLPAHGKTRWPVTFSVNSLRLLESLLSDADFSSMNYRIHGDFLLSESSAMPPIPFEKKGQIGGS